MVKPFMVKPFMVKPFVRLQRAVRRRDAWLAGVGSAQAATPQGVERAQGETSVGP